jgi:hypothetical protein
MSGVQRGPAAIVAITLWLSACGPASAPPRPAFPPKATSHVTWMQARQAARRAREAHDDVASRAALQSLLDLSDSVFVLHDLAATDLRLGDHPRAIAEVQQLVAEGMAVDLDHDADLSALATEPGWASLRARAAANATEVHHARVFAALPADDLITEDLAYDPVSRTFFVSSIRHRKILAVDAASGRTRDFVSEGAGGVDGIAALSVRDGTLWATSVVLPQVLGIDPHAPKRTALLDFDVKTGALVDRIDLPSDGTDHALTDMTVGPDGTAFVSDTIGGAVYAHAPGHHVLSLLSPADELVNPQTPALDADGATLFVADYVRGIAVIDLRSPDHSLTWLRHADDVSLTGIDGLTMCPGGFLAVQNGMVPPRVARLAYDAATRTVTRADVLERATPGLGDPTHGVRVGRAYYFIAGSGWSRYDDDGKPVPSPGADAPAIWRMDDTG